MICLIVTHACVHIVGHACFTTTSAHLHSVSKLNKAPLGTAPRVQASQIPQKQREIDNQRKRNRQAEEADGEPADMNSANPDFSVHVHNFDRARTESQPHLAATALNMENI